MSTLTKDQIQHLAPEQQETLAAIEVQRLKRREQLLQQARHYRGQLWQPLLAFGVLFLVCRIADQDAQPFFVALILWGLIQLHAVGVNRRLNALMELLESDKKKGEEHDS